MFLLQGGTVRNNAAGQFRCGLFIRKNFFKQHLEYFLLCTFELVRPFVPWEVRGKGW